MSVQIASSYFTLAAVLFCLGLFGALTKRNAVIVLLSIELMLNAVNLNLVAFDVLWRDRLHGGQVMTLFTIVIAAAEIGLGLAIVLLVFRNRRMIEVDRLRTLTEQTAPAGEETPQEPRRPAAAAAREGDTA